MVGARGGGQVGATSKLPRPPALYYLVPNLCRRKGKRVVLQGRGGSFYTGSGLDFLT